MQNSSKRICIYPKDIQAITGKSYRQSTRFFQKIRKDLNKGENQLMSVEEFCKYAGLNREEVEPLIKG